MNVWQLIPLGISFLPVGLILGVLYFVHWQHSRDRRRDPLTSEPLALPGASVQKRADDLYEKSLEQYLTAILAAMIVGQFILVRRVTENSQPWGLVDWLAIAGVTGLTLYYAIRIAGRVRERNNCKDGARGEQATAQLVSNILLGSNRLFHDVQCEGFNIDHVVITPAGVFAIETKSRRKPADVKGKDGSEVCYDGKALNFPGWTETEPLEQARRQARWLADYLAKFTGEKYAVKPVVALPGWFVKWTSGNANADVAVINPGSSAWLFVAPKLPPVLDAAAIQRAAFALEKLVPANE